MCDGRIIDRGGCPNAGLAWTYKDFAQYPLSKVRRIRQADARPEILISRWGKRLGDAWIARIYKAFRRQREEHRLLSGNDRLDLALSVIPRCAEFPAQAKVQREVRFCLPGVLHVDGAVLRAGIQDLFGCLGVPIRATIPLRRAKEEVGEIITTHAATKHETPENVREITFVDLQVAGFAADLQRMSAQHPRKPVTCHVRIVGLEGVQ